MMKYQAMTELMSPRPTDLSNLELGHMDNSGGELDLLLNEEPAGQVSHIACI